MRTREDKIKIAEKKGWVCVSESPFELEHPDGFSASGLAAEYTLDGIVENYVENLPLFEDVNFGYVVHGERLPRNETLLSFRQDEGNYAFHEWWDVEGSKLFSEWCSNSNEFKCVVIK